MSKENRPRRTAPSKEELIRTEIDLLRIREQWEDLNTKTRDAVDIGFTAPRVFIDPAVSPAYSQPGPPITTGPKEKPMVTREEYERARVVLDSLPAGPYFKCIECGAWKRGYAHNTRVTVTALDQIETHCEGCA